MLASGVATSDASEETQALRVYETQMQRPVLLLSVFWFALLIGELVFSQSRFFEVFGTVIWVLLILDLLVRIVLSRQKLVFLRSHWLLMLSLALPALRLFQIAHLVSATSAAGTLPSIRFVSLITSFNNSVRTLRDTLRRRAFAYVVALTILITFAGAAGMFVLERANVGFNTYGDALWFTAMIVLTLGSEDWPVTAEGRLLCVLLSIYSFTVLGYLTATLASMFIGADADCQPGAGDEVTDLKMEIESLRLKVQKLSQAPSKSE